MFDSIVQAIEQYPYIGVALLFLLCGIGIPLPEELVLIAGGYVCAKFPDKATLPWMMLWSAASILTFDLLPFVLGRVFGARVLRLRWLRFAVTRKRLAMFDRWFRRRGDLVIFIARFLAGIRVVAFFTAGMMKMPWRRFLLLDGLGIAIIVPLMVFLGHRGAGVIDDVIGRIQAVERGLLWSVLTVLLVAGGWLWLRQRRRRRLDRRPTDTFVEPRLPVQVQPEAEAPVGSGPGPARGALPAESESATIPGDPGVAGDPPADAHGPAELDLDDRDGEEPEGGDESRGEPHGARESDPTA